VRPPRLPAARRPLQVAAGAAAAAAGEPAAGEGGGAEEREGEGGGGTGEEGAERGGEWRGSPCCLSNPYVDLSTLSYPIIPPQLILRELISLITINMSNCISHQRTAMFT